MIGFRELWEDAKDEPREALYVCAWLTVILLGWVIGLWWALSNGFSGYVLAGVVGATIGWRARG